MKNRAIHCLLGLLLFLGSVHTVHAEATDPERDILVTFENTGADTAKLGSSPPYRFRKRYGISASVRRLSRAIEEEYGLASVEHWPIESLSIYCYVYRVPDGANREQVLAQLNDDGRIESAQMLQQFDVRLDEVRHYNDPYLKLQHGLQSLGVIDAHRATLGEGVRVGIIDSHVDVDHDDLRGRIRSFEVFIDKTRTADAEHGTAVASVIGANANNAIGIVGVAPAAMLDILVACWNATNRTVCDSFTLAKALDTVLRDPPQVVNLSLTGPEDQLVGRLIDKVLEAGVVVVAANSSATRSGFPANIPGVFAVGLSESSPGAELAAPGEQILVALPDNQYDVRSGSSLSAAHTSGVIALLLSVVPTESPSALRAILEQSRAGGPGRFIDVCAALQLAGATGCELPRAVRTE